MRILIVATIVCVAGVGAFFVWTTGKTEMALPVECAVLQANVWPETEASPSDEKPLAPFDDILGLHTGMAADAACRAMIERGFALVDHERRPITFGSPSKDMSYVREMTFEAPTTPLGVSQMHQATVELSIGLPVTGYQVEAIEVSYFFADQSTEEPENDDIYAGFTAKYGVPTSSDLSIGAPYAFWVLTEQGLADVPHDVACDRLHLRYQTMGSILDGPADASCQGVLKLDYGGNMNEEITTARYMRYRFNDNARIWNNRIAEYEISQAYRNRSF
ncbi:hypothetical protein BC777_1059 [Yoonia maricola]|uniref:Uncharacterized protein n=1 Tax=Yoonia maricola TaxID=420999 RepID=A0A2M8WMQ6_9RHOB|nr:hypothetical protein [Yoonia maricola]PJI92214.1 hypothetical protein BC777_1059 [Yoonia maricola]